MKKLVMMMMMLLGSRIGDRTAEVLPVSHTTVGGDF
jgi:hypothetical protein